MGFVFRHLPVPDLASTANFEQIQTEYVGSWMPLALGAKVEEAAGLQTLRARTENLGASARMRGAAKVKAGEELKGGETLLTLPPSLRPPGTVKEVTNQEITITSAGVVSVTANLPAASVVLLDNLSFNLT